MVQISCRSSDVAASGGVFDRSRPRSRRSSKSGTTALTGTSSQAGATEPAAIRGVNGWHYPFKKRTYVRYDAGNALATGAAVGRRAVDAMTTSRIQQRMLGAIEWYQRAFQWRPSPCRFSPTCSHYSHEAISMHGPLRGLWLTIRRLLRCRPFGPSGYDPVPEVVHETVSHHHEPMRSQ